MGQQQLLLLVLATVIVGLATVAGIQAFEQGSVRANQDALTQTAVKIASDMQANLKEPAQFGGAGLDVIGDYTSGDAPTLSELGYSTNGSSEYVTEDGDCAIEEPDDGAGQPSVENNSELIIVCESTDNEIAVGIDGLDSDGINTKSTTK